MLSGPAPQRAGVTRATSSASRPSISDPASFRHPNRTPTPTRGPLRATAAVSAGDCVEAHHTATATGADTTPSTIMSASSTKLATHP